MEEACVNVLRTAHLGTGRYVMIVYMTNYLLVKMESFLDWIADSLIDFALEFDDEPFEDEEL